MSHTSQPRGHIPILAKHVGGGWPYRLIFTPIPPLIDPYPPRRGPLTGSYHAPRLSTPGHAFGEIGPAGVERGREPHHRVPPRREAHTSAARSCHGAGALIPLRTPQRQGGTPSLIQWATPGHNTRGSGQGITNCPPLPKKPVPKGGARPVGGAGIPAANPLYQGGTPVRQQPRERRREPTAGKRSKLNVGRRYPSCKPPLPRGDPRIVY